MQAGREIKFRAWDTRSEEMHYFDLRSYMYMCEGAQDDACPPSASDKLMQSINRHDIKGKEIYEGDIIEAGHDDGAVYLEVAYDQEHARFVFTDREEDEWLDSYEWDEFEIIVKGNIYENPELLEVDK